MPNRCCVYQCSEPVGFIFPRDQKLRKRWIHAVRRDKWAPTENSLVCPKHFLPTDFLDGPTAAGSLTRKRRRLKPSAVPSVFFWNQPLSEKDHSQLQRIKRRQALKESDEKKAQEHHEVPLDACDDLDNYTGVPAPMWYRAHPDWLPTVNMHLASKKPMDAVSKYAGGCLALSCQKARKKKTCAKKSFFLFPKEEERCRSWIQSLRREEFLRRPPLSFYCRKYVLCSDHFREDQFVHNSDRKRLIHDAIPTLFMVPGDSLKSSLDDAQYSSRAITDAPPVLGEGCFWPTIDHTYCSSCLVEEKSEKPDGAKTQSGAEKSVIQRKKGVQSAATKRKGLASKTKAKRSPKVSKNGAKKSKLCVKIKSEEKKEVCCAMGCQTGHHKSNKSLFVFPVHKARCSEWLQNLGRQDLVEKSPHQLRSEGYRVCSNHFEADHIILVRQRVQLTRSAVPTLLKSGERQAQKRKPAEGKRSRPPARQKKCRGQAKECPDSDLLQIKVEIDWAEDPALHCSTQVLSRPGTSEEQMVLPSVSQSDLNTSSNSEILNCIKLEPVEEGKEMEYIKPEPVEEERPFWGDRESLMDFARHRSTIYGESNFVDDDERSPLQVCVSDIKTEPDTDDMAQSQWIQSFHHANSDIKTEPDNDDMVGLHWMRSLHANIEQVSNVEPFSNSSELTGGQQVCSSNEQVQYKHFNSECTTSSQSMNSSEPMDSIEQVGGNDIVTFPSKLIEDNDLDMSYTVVKVEPESDMEDV